MESDGGVRNTYWLLNEAPSIHRRMKSCFVSIAGTIRDCPAAPKDRQGCTKHSDTPTEAPGSAGDFRSSQRLPAKHHRAPEASSVFLMSFRPMRSCAIHVHKHSVEAMILQQCREVTAVILSITPWLPTYMGQSLIRCNTSFPPRDIRPRIF